MASSYQQKFPVPDGFPELLHDLMKAILREQPADIVEYSYQFFKNMSEGKGEPHADRKNYYGDQMEGQTAEGRSQVIPKPEKPATRGQSGKSEVKTHNSGGTQVTQKSEVKSHKSGGTQVTHKTRGSKDTENQVGGGYCDDLADAAIQIYENTYDEG
jgi:hypothetical protein